MSLGVSDGAIVSVAELVSIDLSGWLIDLSGWITAASCGLSLLLSSSSKSLSWYY